MKLSDHFTLKEATFSETAARLGIDNSPNKGQLAAMQYSARYMDVLRDALGDPINVSSWLRVKALNLAIPGSSNTSAHMIGYAIDCRTARMTPYEFCNWTVNKLSELGIVWDQIIHEYGSWMHISFDPRGRKQTLTIFKNNQGKKYLPGILTKQEYLAK